jgi:hypothetical protein
VLADRHYNRQSHGLRSSSRRAGAFVLLTADRSALWVTFWPLAEYVRHAWPGAWVCSLFRNERADPHLSSDLITAAVAHTRALARGARPRVCDIRRPGQDPPQA